MRVWANRIEIEHPIESNARLELAGEWITFVDSEESTVAIDPSLVLKLYKFMLANKDALDRECGFPLEWLDEEE